MRNKEIEHIDIFYKDNVPYYRITYDDGVKEEVMVEKRFRKERDSRINRICWEEER